MLRLLVYAALVHAAVFSVAVSRAMAATSSAQLQPGYFMVTANGAELVDTKLQPVWVHAGLAENLKRQTFEGKPVLTWWQGKINSDGIGSGTLNVVNEHYRLVATLQASHGWHLDMHDAVLSGHVAWVTAYRYRGGVKFGPGSGRGYVIDDAVQEYDLRNGRLLRTWDALRHVPPTRSLEKPPDPAGTVAWDPYHANSIQLIGAHHFLVSMRNTSAAYLIDTRKGRIVWTLGGKHSTFKSSPLATFRFQHSVSLHPGGIVTLFDDSCCDVEARRPAIPYGPSRGLVLKLNIKNRTASFVQQYVHDPELNSQALGNMQVLPNGNVLIGWGTEPYFSEYTRAGELLLDAPISSYRALLTANWVGTPFYPPSARVQQTGGAKAVYARWNGATEVASWQVLGGPSATQLTPVASAAKNGFVTTIPIPNQRYPVLQVKAVDAKGHVLGSVTIKGP